MQYKVHNYPSTIPMELQNKNPLSLIHVLYMPTQLYEITFMNTFLKAGVYLN